MRTAVNIDKNVIIALAIHGVSSQKIAEYLMKDVARQVEDTVVDICNALDGKK